MNLRWLGGAALLPLLLSGAQWDFKDGEGSARVREKESSGLNAAISRPHLAVWAREDDRGWFLNLKNGGAVVVPHHDSLAFPDGFSARLRFSYDPDKIGRTNFANLFTRGSDFRQGYCVMAGRHGELLLNLKGFTPEYKIVKAGLRANVDHLLEIHAGNGRVRVFVDGVEMSSYPVKGRLAHGGGRQVLRLGELPGYPFTGNLYSFAIGPYAEPKTKAAARPVPPPSPTSDPAGTRIVDQFEEFTPGASLRYARSFSGSERTWIIRRIAFMAPSRQVLHSPFSPDAELAYAPGLKGRYDVYALFRLVNSASELQFNLDGGDRWIRVATPDVGDRHRNVEVLLARDVAMDGKTLRIAPAGGPPVYLGCLKFVPAGAGKSYRADPAVKVMHGKKFTDGELDAVSEQSIRKRLADGYFREVRFVDGRPFPALPAAARKRGFHAFEQPWMQLLFPRSIPGAERAPSPVVRLAPGEFEPCTVGVYALRTSSLKLRCVKPFPEGLDARISVVGILPKRSSNYVGPSEFIRMPNYLEESDSATVPARENRQFWITLHAAEGLAPGRYQAEFELSGRDGALRFPVTAEVRPFRLAPADGYDIGFWINFGGMTAGQCREMIRIHAEHGMTSFVGGEFFVLTGRGEDDYAIDFARSPVTAIAEACKQYRMPGNMIIAADQLNRGRAFERLVRQVEKYAREHQWPPRLYTILDEVPSHPAEFPRFRAGCETLKKAGVRIFADHIWFKTSRPLQKQIDEVTPFIDVFANRFNTRKFFYVDGWEDMERKAAAAKRRLYAYNSNNALTCTIPAGMRFMSGWFFRSLGRGTFGQMIWTFSLRTLDPYTDLDGNRADWCYVYPPRGSRKGGPAINFEAFREGVDDLRYILTLEREIARARRAGRLRDADRGAAVVARIAGSVDRRNFYRRSLFIDSVWTDWRVAPDKSVEVSGELLPPVGWSSERYNAAREEVATEIIRLRKLDGEKK